MAKEKENNPDLISQENAFANALIEGAKFILNEASDGRNKNRATLDPKALEINDINGKILFYDFDFYSGKDQLGTIRASANRTIGAPVISIRLGTRKWNLQASKRKINEIVKKKFSKYGLKNTLVVCYSYPKIGLMVNLTDGKEIKSIIFDISDYTIIQERNERLNSEGSYAWSFLDSIERKEIPARLRRYKKSEELTKKVFKKESGKSIYRLNDLVKVADRSRLVYKLRNEKKLQFCTHYKYDETGSHHCFILHAQEVNDYCSVATCQMILCYYRYYFSQDDIAPELGYSSGGGCPADVSAGYESLSNDHLNSSYDTSPTWAEARDQINLLQPMKSGVPGHARAIAGYSSNIYAVLGSSTSDKKLYVYDPWPWNADLKAGGDIYWEDWDSITHTNFVYTELDY